jgi:hypothetical protein
MDLLEATDDATIETAFNYTAELFDRLVRIRALCDHLEANKDDWRAILAEMKHDADVVLHLSDDVRRKASARGDAKRTQKN